MTSKRFFANVWRVNAVAILLIAVLVVGGLLIAAVAFIRDATRTRQASGMVNVTRDVGKESTRLGSFEPVAGTTVLRAPLYREQEYEVSVMSKETSSIQNYLFFAPAENRSYWLVNGPKWLFSATHNLPDDYSSEKTSVKLVIYEVVSEDSNRDNRLTAEDLKTIYVADPAGLRFVPIVQKVSQVNGTHLPADGTVVVLYTSANVLRGALIDPDGLKVVRDSAITPSATR